MRNGVNRLSVIINAENISKIYDNGVRKSKVISSVDLKIYENEIVVIMGPSGAGKSTLLYLLGAMSQPTSGSIYYKDEDITFFSDKQLSRLRRQEFGFVFQSFNLIPVLTSSENIVVPLLLDKQKEDKKQVNELLKLVNLDGFQESRPYELSGGQQQRVAIARSLVNNPKVIFADEPTGSLDSQSEDEILGLFVNISNKVSKTFVIVTHSEKVAMIADRIITMQDGVIVEQKRKRKLS